MKARSLIIFSIVSLLFVVLVQLGGMIYAYHAQMKESEQSLNKCFWMAFTETVDNVVNTMPYPDGTILNIVYAPSRLKLNMNDYNKLGSEQTAQVLQKIYGVKCFPMAAMDSLLHKKLEHAYIVGKVTIERFNVNTGEVLESTQPDIHTNFTTVTSEKAFVYKERGEAIRAIVAFPFGTMMRNVLILFGITFLLLAVAVYALVVQMKSLVNQRRSIATQQRDFYMLAEQMRVPVTEMLSEMPAQAWSGIEEKSAVLLEMTEKTLSKAKTEAQGTQQGKHYSFKMVSAFSLVGVFLLLAVWAGYLYHISYKKMELHAEEHFEEAFYNETFYHRYLLFAAANKYEGSGMTASPTPYALGQYDAFRDLYKKKGYHIRMNYVFVVHIYNKFDVNYRLHAAYTLQDTINNNTKMYIPFSLQYADSAFNSELRKGGIPNRGDVQWLSYPSQKTLLYTGSSQVGKVDIATKLIPLSKDSTYCVRGIVRAPQVYIMTSIWYMLLPLGVTLLFICVCIFLQIRMLLDQRRLKQFQKDFSYSMIHDMKSPLNSVMMGTHILSGGKLSDKPDKVMKYKEVITDECEHLLQLSNRVLMLTQIDKGELQLHRETVLLKPLLKDITEKFLLRAPKEIHFQVECEESCMIFADIFCLQELLSNLIDNAIKYSGDRVEIVIACAIEVTSDQTLTSIRVRDNGIGIPLKAQRKIFDKFERVSEHSSKTGASGFGLGLNYVMRVVEAHEGRISVESVEGKYSEFTIEMPNK